MAKLFCLTNRKSENKLWQLRPGQEIYIFLRGHVSFILLVKKVIFYQTHLIFQHILCLKTARNANFWYHFIWVSISIYAIVYLLCLYLVHLYTDVYLSVISICLYQYCFYVHCCLSSGAHKKKTIKNADFPNWHWLLPPRNNNVNFTFNKNVGLNISVFPVSEPSVFSFLHTWS